MEWTTYSIINNPHTHYELENASRNLSGYHVYNCAAFDSYMAMKESEKLVYILDSHDLTGDSDSVIIEEYNIVGILDSTDF